MGSYHELYLINYFQRAISWTMFHLSNYSKILLFNVIQSTSALSHNLMREHLEYFRFYKWCFNEHPYVYILYTFIMLFLLNLFSGSRRKRIHISNSDTCFLVALLKISFIQKGLCVPDSALVSGDRLVNNNRQGSCPMELAYLAL